MVTYQYVVCLSNKPRDSPYPESNPLPDLLEDEEVPKVDEKAEGEAVIEVSFVSWRLEEGEADDIDIYCWV
jgi:hypothetical protein